MRGYVAALFIALTSFVARADIRLSPDGKYVAISKDASHVEIKGAGSAKKIEANAFAWLPNEDATILIAAPDDKLKLFDIRANRLIHTYPLPITVDKITFSQSGKRLALSKAHPGKGSQTAWGEWDIKAGFGNPVDIAETEEIEVEHVALSSQNFFLVNVGSKTWQFRHLPDDGPDIDFEFKHNKYVPAGILFTPEGENILSLDTDGGLHLFNQRALSDHDLGVLKEPAIAMAISHDGRLLATATQTSVSFWDLTKGTKVIVEPALSHAKVHTAKIAAVQFSRDDRNLFIVSESGEVQTAPSPVRPNPVGKQKTVAFDESDYTNLVNPGAAVAYDAHWQIYDKALCSPDAFTNFFAEKLELLNKVALDEGDERIHARERFYYRLKALRFYLGSALPASAHERLAKNGG